MIIASPVIMDTNKKFFKGARASLCPMQGTCLMPASTKVCVDATVQSTYQEQQQYSEQSWSLQPTTNQKQDHKSFSREWQNSNKH